MATLQKGSHGEEVRQMQSQLQGLGYDVGSAGADGIFGDATRSAVLSFQSDRGLSADGIVGDNTWAALNNSQASEPEKSKYDLSDYLRQQQAAKTEAALANLKSAYDTSVRGYDDAASKIPQMYDTARNNAAAQAAMSKRNFDTRAAMTGMNTGTGAQADLASSNAYMQALSGLDREQNSKLADIDNAKANLQAQYESSIAQAKAENDAELANALYNEMIRVQTLQREDEANAAALAAARASSGVPRTSETPTAQDDGVTDDAALSPLETFYATGKQQVSYPATTQAQVDVGNDIAARISRLKANGADNATINGILQAAREDGDISEKVYRILWNTYVGITST